MRTNEPYFRTLGKTIACSRMATLIVIAIALIQAGCGTRQPAAEEHAEEALSRTEFTERIENFFEHDPLKAGKTSQFLIHLTDLSDGSPVEKAEVTLITRAKDGSEVMQTKARVGKVTGIYVADVSIPNRGDYDIEFHVNNARLDERMPLKDFKVE
ncbi:MAG TPA: FixH family protein [Pyrinomonadaceae bacterium]|nr:FixH family protein [Pyrinomonadaceae bacterium]